MTTPAQSAPDGSEDLLADLRAVLGDHVDPGARRRAEYSGDGSNYRVLPEVVVFPRHADEVAAVVDIAARHARPVTARGGGTSVAGNAIGSGVLLDVSRHLDAVVDLDPVARTARVQPGVLLGSLQEAARPFGLRFGPDPSTWARATLGGMIGNDACGSHSLAFGRTSDNVIGLDVVTGDGRRLTLADDLAVVTGLADFTTEYLGTIRTQFGRFGRHVSGYGLERLLPERGHSPARALVGSEGTCVLVTEATLRLVPVPSDPLLVVLGYPSMTAAADDVPAVLDHAPGAVEGLGRELVDVVRSSRGDSTVPALPAGAGWLLVELSGDDPRETAVRARRLVAASGALDAVVHEAGAAQRAVWRIREDGAGLAGRTAAGRPAWPGIEDAAVPPERLGAYLRDFEALLARQGLSGIPYGHFGDGCIHVRVDVPLEHDGGALRRLMEEAAALVVEHGGSISGEHGDGRARSELLDRMYRPDALAAMAAFKSLFDPHGVLNPGVVVDPPALDADLRRPTALPLPRRRGFAFAHDDGDLTTAAHRCVGVGKCRVPTTAPGSVMCPSYVATRDEKDSTRGRARVLQETLIGAVDDDRLGSPELADSLDLCLSCKACSRDCPAGVDMAAYKSEVLHRRYAGRLRPRTHYTLGRLPVWARLATRVARPLNGLLAWAPLRTAALALAGIDTRRRVPRLAPRRRTRHRTAPAPGAPEVLLWVDTFSECFSPDVVDAAVRVLERAGYSVLLPEGTACCGLTWVTTGQLDQARRRLSGLLDVVHPHVAAGRPVVGLEPSCTATLRSDLVELLPGDARAGAVADAVSTLAELVSTGTPSGWRPSPLDGRRVVVQPHCHHHAVLGFGPDRRLLSELGADVVEVGGCCGLAGNFGMERGHYEVSVAVAETALLPALRADPDAVLLADGFSCRVQADQLAGRAGVHLAQLLDPAPGWGAAE